MVMTRKRTKSRICSQTSLKSKNKIKVVIVIMLPQMEMIVLRTVRISRMLIVMPIGMLRRST